MSIADILVFGYASVGFLYVQVGAQLYLVEVLAVLIVLHAFLSPARAVRVPKVLSVTLAIWLLGTLLSDLYNESTSQDFLRGLARVIAVWFLLYAVTFLVAPSTRRVFLLWSGVCVSLVLSNLIAPNPYFAGEPWKFGYGVPVSLAVFLLASTWLRSYAFLLAGGLAIIHLAAGSRSLAIVCLIVALTLLLRRQSRRGTGRIIAIALIGAALLIAVVVVYDRLSSSGFFGVERQVRASYQAAGALGSFLTGRGEIFFSVRSILEHPLFGVGSYGQPSADVLQAQVTYLLSEGYTAVGSNYLANGLASFHSEVLGSVAENGILALPFWLVVLGLLVKGIVAVLTKRAPLSALLAFICVLGLWDAFFSPFGADRKFWLAATIASILALTSQGRTRDADLRDNGKLQSSPIP